MDKQKEIEEMAELIHGKHDKNGSYKTAKALVEAGYGNAKQAVREFAEKLKDKMLLNQLETTNLIMLLNQLGTANKYNEGYSNAFCYIQNIIDELFKELYGED